MNTAINVSIKPPFLRVLRYLKKLSIVFSFLAIIGLSTISKAAVGGGPGGLSINFIENNGSTVTQRQVLNFTGSGVSVADNAISTRTDVTITSGGGSSSLRVSIGPIQISSPTQTISFNSSQFSGNLTGGTTANISLLPGSTFYIQNTNSLQSGSTFYVSSGTVQGQFTVSTPQYTLYFAPTSTNAIQIINKSSDAAFIQFWGGNTALWRAGPDAKILGLPTFDIYNESTGNDTISISTNDVITVNGTMVYPNLTASQPLKLNSSKQVISGLINVTTDITGTVPSGNLPSNVAYTNVSNIFSSSQTFLNGLGDVSLSSGNCVQAGGGGLLLSASAPCGSGSGGGITPGSTFYIQNTNSLQSGATFYVSSGTAIVLNSNNVNISSAASSERISMNLSGLYSGSYFGSPVPYSQLWSTMPNFSVGDYFFIGTSTSGSGLSATSPTQIFMGPDGSANGYIGYMEFDVGGEQIMTFAGSTQNPGTVYWNVPISAGSVYVTSFNDSGLSASSNVCTDGSKNLTTTGCSSGGGSPSLYVASVTATYPVIATTVGTQGSTVTISVNGSSVTLAGPLIAGTNITLTPSSSGTTISSTGGGGGSPGGFNNELQYRSNSTTFGAVPGSTVTTSGNIISIQAKNTSDNLFNLQEISGGYGKMFNVRNGSIDQYTIFQSSVVTSDNFYENGNLYAQGINGLYFGSSGQALLSYGGTGSNIILSTNTGISGTFIVGNGGNTVAMGSPVSHQFEIDNSSQNVVGLFQEALTNQTAPLDAWYNSSGVQISSINASAQFSGYGGNLLSVSSVTSSVFQSGISAGSNVTVTNTGNGVSISASGGGSTLPLPPGDTNYIQNTNSLQSGATFYVSSGTALNFNVNDIHLPVTSTSPVTIGVIYQNGSPLLQTIGTNNVFFGINSGNFNVTGTDNTGVGFDSLLNNTSGSDNFGDGSGSLYSNTTGYGNVGVGYRSLYSNVSSFYNTGIGTQALYSNTGSYNIGIGNQSLYSGTSGSYNIAIGWQAMYSGVVTAQYNIAIGAQALNDDTSGASNCAIGVNALNYDTTGSNNIGIGEYALISNVSGGNNIGLGMNAGRANTNGNYLTFLGIESGHTGTNDGLSYSSAFGSYAQVTANNTMVLSNSGSYHEDVTINATAGYGAALNVSPNNASSVAEIIQGASSQSADLQEWKNSSSAVLAKVDAGGGITSSTVTASSQLVLPSLANTVLAVNGSGVVISTTVSGSSGSGSLVSLSTGVTGILPPANSEAATSSISTATLVVNWALSYSYRITLNANTTFTFSNNQSGQTITVAVTNTSGNYTVTWPTVTWPNGITPTQTNGAHTDIYTFIQVGSIIYGNAVQNY